MRPIRRALLAAVAAAALAACAHYPVNPELTAAPNPANGYRWATTDIPASDKSTFVILTFSGGGTRAAGFSYAVLQQLDAITMSDGRKLLDHVDVISSVSGGSFTSMYFGLRGRDGFKTFESDFLRQDIEGRLIHEAFFVPRNWFRLLSPNFHRIDLAAEVYDDALFKNATFDELLRVQKQSHRPLIIANSTEVEIGSRFEWTQDQFDPICSDLTTVHVARAVAASSAFPVLLSPMVLDTYRKCGYTKPTTWVANARNDVYSDPSRPRMADELDDYTNLNRTHLHLLDGGIADNIGLRAPLHAITSLDTFVEPQRHPERTGFTIANFLSLHEIRRLLVIVVNAGTSTSKVTIDATAREPNLVKVLGSVTGTPMENYSFDSVEQMLETFRTRAVEQEAAKVADRTVYYPVVLSFSLIQDDGLRKTVNDIGTNFFKLDDKNFDALMEAAKVLLARDPCFQRFLLDSSATPAPTGAAPRCAAIP